MRYGNDNIIFNRRENIIQNVLSAPSKQKEWGGAEHSLESTKAFSLFTFFVPAKKVKSPAIAVPINSLGERIIVYCQKS